MNDLWNCYTQTAPKKNDVIWVDISKINTLLFCIRKRRIVETKNSQYEYSWSLAGFLRCQPPQNHKNDGTLGL